MNYMLGKYRGRPDKGNEDPVLSVLASNYKPVALKVKLVYAELPEHFRIKHEITGDPLVDLPKLNPNPPDFTPTGHYTQERMNEFDQIHKEGFLLPDE